jgi:hypothetical protein
MHVCHALAEHGMPLAPPPRRTGWMANRLEFEATTVLSKDPFACMCALPCPALGGNA